MDEHRLFHSPSKSRWVAVTAIMSALALVGNYILVALPNIELGSGVLFVTAYLFGLQMGFWCVLIVSIIYAFFNPWGPFIPTIWIAQLVGWGFMVLAGYLLGTKHIEESKNRNTIFELATIGGFVTLFFDLITTLGYSLWFGIPYYLAIISGMMFIAIHVISNALIFPTIVPLLDTALRNQIEPILVVNKTASQE